MTDISQNIKFFRKKNGLSQSQLAEQLNVTRQTVSSWETDKSYPDLDMIVLLSAALDTDPNSLIYPATQKKGQGYRQVSFKATLFTMIGFFIFMTFFAGFWGMVFQSIIGGGISETYLYPIYAGIILLAGLIVFCTCIIREEIRNYVYYKEIRENESI